MLSSSIMRLPIDSEDQIRQSVASFLPLKGYDKLPLAKKDRSVIHQYGVVVVKSGQVGNPLFDVKILERYYCCLSSAVCIKNKVMLTLSNTTTSTATTHLKNLI